MSLEVRSFEVYGFTIEVHAGGRRVWPPSLKRFINEKMDRGELSVGEIMKTCNVSQSLAYKWRADVKASRIRTTTVTEDTYFAEIVVDEERDTIGTTTAHHGPVAVSCRPKCSFKPLSVRRRQGFSNLMLSGGVVDYRSR